MNEATIARKQQEVQAVAEKMANAGTTVFVDYLGLTVAEVSELRRKLHTENCEMKVVKNNILRRAAQSLGHEGVVEHLVGPSAMITSKDEVSALKITYDFLKEHDKLSVKVGIVSNAITEEKDLKALSALPNKDGMISMLLSVLQAPMRGLACALNAVSEQK